MPDFSTLIELYGIDTAKAFISNWYDEHEKAEEELYWAEQMTELEQTDDDLDLTA